jgi:hypothetical protein
MNTRYDKGGRCDIADSKGIANSLHKNSFASTEWAIEKDEIASYALRTNALTECMHIGSCSNSDHLLRVKEREGLVSQTPSFTLSYY